MFMEGSLFGTDYYQNLRIILRAGYSLSEANTLASKVTRIKRKEEIERYRSCVINEIKKLG